MKLPLWVPEVRRPFNPAFRDTWQAMSHPNGNGPGWRTGPWSWP